MPVKDVVKTTLIVFILSNYQAFTLYLQTCMTVTCIAATPIKYAFFLLVYIPCCHEADCYSMCRIRHQVHGIRSSSLGTRFTVFLCISRRSKYVRVGTMSHEPLTITGRARCGVPPGRTSRICSIATEVFVQVTQLVRHFCYVIYGHFLTFCVLRIGRSDAARTRSPLLARTL